MLVEGKLSPHRLPATIVRGMICGMLDPFDPDSFIVRAEVHILDVEPKISRTLELPISYRG
jgi:hypothetical protein